jgi:hypothetical protein
MIICDKNNGRGRFQTAHFIVLAGTGPEIGDPRLGKQAVGRFGDRFSTRSKTADKTGWVPFPKRVAGRFGTRFSISVYPFSGPFYNYVPNTLKNGRQPVLKTGRGPFWYPSWNLVCARFQGRFSRWPERPPKRAGSRFQNGQRAVLGPVLEIGVCPF